MGHLEYGAILPVPEPERRRRDLAAHRPTCRLGTSPRSGRRPRAGSLGVAIGMAAVAVARYGHRRRPVPGTSATATVRMTRPRVSTCLALASRSPAVPSSVCRRRSRSRENVWARGYSRQPVDPASGNPSTTRSSVGAGDTAVTSWPSPGDITRTPVASRP